METIKVALGAIWVNKLRSFLTMLGIVIGVAAVITMVALGSGAQQAVEDQIAALGANLLSVNSGQSYNRGVASNSRVSLTTDDSDALIAASLPGVSAITPAMQSNYQVKLAAQNINVPVIGTTANYHEVNNYRLEAGRMFTESDDQARKLVAVLGFEVPDQLGVNRMAIVGQTIAIRGLPFEVIGVLSEKGSQGFDNPDERILIPLRTGRFRVFGNDRLRTIQVQASSGDSMGIATIGIEGVLRREHSIRPGGDNDFRIQDQTEFLSTQQATTETFTFLLAGIAAVSLLVGGIGIMNIMLVSVTERTREIGIRKALGARRRTILFQFLVEAMTLCILGGMVGVSLGAGTATTMARLQGWNTAVSPQAIIVAFVFSAAVGVFFGMWPARRASKLDPIVALRYE